MSTTYTGLGINAVPSTSPTETIPADGDALTAASANGAFQKLLDYIANASSPGLVEGFESATFPPTTQAWTAPSARYGSDFAYVRNTGTPLVGTASADRSGSQTASTNSSLGLSAFLPSPSRIAFNFSVTCNTNSDFLQFFIDGVQVGSFTSGAANINKGGRFVSDVLREGVHTFDWRFTRGASASVGSEQAKVDAVELVPESAWLGDDLRLYFKDDFVFSLMGSTPLLTMTAGAGGVYGAWQTATGANVGKVLEGTPLGGPFTGTQILGAIALTTAGTAIGDYASLSLNVVASAAPFVWAKQPFIEAAILAETLLTNRSFYFGWTDGSGVATPVNGMAWFYDSSVGATWRIRTWVASAVTDIDTGITVVADAYHRFGLSASAVPANSIVATYDGKSIPITTGLMVHTANLPSVVGLYPAFLVKSIGVAGARILDLDWFRMLSLR